MSAATHRVDPSGELRRVSAAALRILSSRDEPRGAQALLATAPGNVDASILAQWRGRIDALAQRARYSDPELHARLSPLGGLRELLFNQLEQARVDALVDPRLAGMRANLAALHGARPPWTGSALVDAARRYFGAPLSDASAVRDHDWTAATAAESAAHLQRMAALLHDQPAFAAEALLLIAATVTADDAGGDQRPSLHPSPELRERARAARQPERPGAPADAEPREVGILRRISREPRGIVVPQQVEAGVGTGSYHAYTRRHDRIVDARDLCDPAQRSQLERQLSEQLRLTRSGLARWAHRLQRHLLVRQMRSWQFDYEEGVLDAARLTRVVTDPLKPLSFKQEASEDFPLTAISILVDCSGSMRGTPIAIAAACTELLGLVLERCGVRTEILGFTTARWRGGRSREQWLLEGRRDDPGRLTDLLHIVFKDGDVPWRRARRNLAVMLDDALLKENVDGEALQWAHERLLRRPEPRRILMVISDGAPLDDSTLVANDPGYLDRHLRSVIRDIEASSPVDLYAIGIGHNVGAYYSRAFTVSGPEDLGEAMVTQLIALFDSPTTRGSTGKWRGAA